MEKSKEVARVNVMAFSEKRSEDYRGDIPRVISVQQSLQTTYGLNKKTTQYAVCLGIVKPDNDPNDTGIEGIYLSVDNKEELDKLIKALQSLRGKIWSGVFKDLE